jgi:hypothetical protein
MLGCVAMLAIAIVLVATGAAGVGFIFAPVMCAGMMAMIMTRMGGMGGRNAGEHR